MNEQIQQLEAQLDSFDINERKQALSQLIELASTGQIEFAKPTGFTNMHFHTFFSFNAENYSPTKVAWLSKKQGLSLAGTVDFDVLDALDEFYQAAELLDLKASVGIETRVYIPEFADKVINSPGEPGVAYHMGAAMPSSKSSDQAEKFKQMLRNIPDSRNRIMVEKVNEFLSPVQLDYEKEVYPLTPANNPTERHLCLAYAKKAEEIFPDKKELSNFWQQKLDTDPSTLSLPLGRNLMNTLRAKTMKRGGVGYTQPGTDTFPKMADMNQFVLDMGGVPMLAWLDGTSDGEQDMENLLNIAMSTGVAAVNIVPDRNFTLGEGLQNQKCKNLYDFIALAEKHDLPICVGTEMNSPGLKFMDNFQADELKPHVDKFLTGAHIMYAHSVLKRTVGIGYVGTWAQENFDNTKDKNNFFETIGKKISPSNINKLQDFKENTKPDKILSKI